MKIKNFEMNLKFENFEMRFLNLDFENKNLNFINLRFGNLQFGIEKFEIKNWKP